MQMQELQLKAQEIQNKAQRDQAEIQVKMQQIQVDRERIAAASATADKQREVDVLKNAAQLGLKQTLDQGKQVMEAQNFK